MYYPVILGIEVVLAIIIIFLILLYRGKGADVGAVFTGSSSVFGAKGSVPFTTKLIAILCAIFIANSLLLTYLANRTALDRGVLDSIPVQEMIQKESDVPMENKSTEDLSDIPTNQPTQR